MRLKNLLQSLLFPTTLTDTKLAKRLLPILGNESSIKGEPFEVEKVTETNCKKLKPSSLIFEYIFSLQAYSFILLRALHFTFDFQPIQRQLQSISLLSLHL